MAAAVVLTAAGAAAVAPRPVAPTAERAGPGSAGIPGTPPAAVGTPAVPAPPGAPVWVVADDDGRVSAALGTAGVPHVRVGRGVLRVAGVLSGGDRRPLAPEGFALWWDVRVADPVAYAAHVTDDDARRLIGTAPAGSAVVGHRAATRGGLAPGDALEVADGPPVPVHAVVDDRWIGGADGLVATGPGAPPPPVEVHGTAVVVAHPDPVAVVVGVDGGPPPPAVDTAAVGSLTHTTAVLVTAEVKELFGEPALAPGPGRALVADPGWADAHIVSGEVPLLGWVECHRRIWPVVGAAMADLADRGLGHLVDPGAVGGCWVPRRIRPGGGVSRHTWGIAVDLNVGFPEGVAPGLVAVMEAHGFTWGDGGGTPTPSTSSGTDRGRSRTRHRGPEDRRTGNRHGRRVRRRDPGGTLVTPGLGHRSLGGPRRPAVPSPACECSTTAPASRSSPPRSASACWPAGGSAGWASSTAVGRWCCR